ncbi:unnamed protein product [Lathyrus sativus]|nr:unnamed protein product [Lathyrus sativus]
MSSLSKAPTNNSTEESGWTSYFDDFFNNNDDDDNLNNINHKCSNSLSLSTSSSLLSDATSLVGKNALFDQNVEKEVSSNKNGEMGSSFKKRKNIVDQALEDTATSPLNTPKEKRKAIVEDKKN